MQSVSSRIWTRVAVSISYDDNHYTTGTSRGPEIYKGDKGVSDAAHPPEGGPAEAGGLSTSILPFIFDTRPVRIPDSPAYVG